MYKAPQFICEAKKKGRLEALQEAKKLKIALGHRVVELRESGGKRVVIATNMEGQNVMLEVDHIVFCCGFVINSEILSIFKNLALDIDENLIKVDVNTMRTSIENCYAVGDVVAYANRKRAIVSCFFEADRAVQMIKNAVMQVL
jgi:thioredoxin reductase